MNLVNGDTFSKRKAEDMKIVKIVLTGGPCGGKSTATEYIKEALHRLGYTVLYVNEAATELIKGGIAPWTCGTHKDFQRAVFAIQRAKEKAVERAAVTMADKDKILMICDRGALDNKAYLEEGEYASFLDDIQMSEAELRDSYDGVFHLVSAAEGAEAFYTTENNAARTETLEEARALDKRLLAAWVGHPHLRVIDNSTDFQGKMERLIQEITALLGENRPYEIERKFLIEYPDISWLEAQGNCRRVEIVQTYLTSPEGEEIRVRQRSEGEHDMYFLTVKRKISEIKREETERRITADEYLKLLMQADATRKQIRKSRFCMVYEHQYLEIDVYPFWNHQAILEVELPSEDAPVYLPEAFRVIREVTDDPGYKNAALAMMEQSEL